MSVKWYLKNKLNYLRKKIPDNHPIRVAYSNLKSVFEFFLNLKIYLKLKKMSDLAFLAITWTDWKTSSAIFTAQLLKKLWKKVWLISSQEIRIANTIYKNNTKRTTPWTKFIWNFINQCIQQNCDVIIMEVSAHAISQWRIFGLKFDSVAFTNLSQEHWDYYSNIELYWKTKLKLFKKLKKSWLGILNLKTFQKYKFIKEFVKNNSIRYLFFWDYKIAKEIDLKKHLKLTYQIEEANLQYTKFKLFYWANTFSTQLFVPWVYNVENVCVAIAFALELWYWFKEIVNQVPNLSPIGGRLQKVVDSSQKWFDIFVDFAVTPQALEAVLQYLSSIKKNKLRIVFGATGWNHDHQKRPIMWQISNKYADAIVLTEDESYWESVFNIFNDILWWIWLSFWKNIEKKVCKINSKITCIVDRYEAIDFAIKHLKKWDILIITWMWDLQSRNDWNKEINWSDIDVVKKILKI